MTFFRFLGNMYLISKWFLLFLWFLCDFFDFFVISFWFLWFLFDFWDFFVISVIACDISDFFVISRCVRDFFSGIFVIFSRCLPDFFSDIFVISSRYVPDIFSDFSVISDISVIFCDFFWVLCYFFVISVLSLCFSWIF